MFPNEMARMNIKGNVEVFNQDVLQGQGYKYTTDDRPSTRLANARMTQGIREATDWSGKSVLDIGCGDGTFTNALIEMGAAKVLGLDPASAAIEKAIQHAKGNPLLHFEVGNAYQLETLQQRFDIAVFRGVLHHLPDAASAVQLAAKVADEIVILEPNGTNPVLKGIEKLSSYHRLHEEQSFLPSTIRKWCSDAGAVPIYGRFINLVPIFCPSALGYVLKLLEPVVEGIPILRNIACGQIVIRAVVSR